MDNVTNRNKIYTVLVICIGIIISVWLVKSSSNVKNYPQLTEKTVVTEPYRNIERSDDWKKILTAVDNSKIDTSLISQKDTSAVAEPDNTVTDQVSRDFLSQYLLAVKNKGGTTPEDAVTIAQNTISLSNFGQSGGAKYIASNLKINTSTDSSVLRSYRNKLQKIIFDRTTAVKDDPIRVVVTSLSTEDEQELKKLDGIIAQSKGFIDDLLKLETPKNAVALHLSLLNSASLLLSNLEAMREILNDPIRGLSGIGQYSQTLLQVNLAIENFSKYFIQNL